MNDATGKKYDLSDDDDKQLLKEKVFGQVFYSKTWTPWWGNGVYAVAFAAKFPVLCQAIADAKVKDHRLLPRAMQFIEAEGVMAIVEKLAKKPYPLITIHDAIVTTYENAIEVGHAIRAVFAEMKLTPRLKLVELKP